MIWKFCIAAFGVFVCCSASASAWAPKQAPLMTPWAAKVDPNNTLPEYPRPQMVRADWLNLNGVWQFQPGAKGDETPIGKTFPGEILVPFPVESALSGVMEHHDRLWYRRLFTVPATWGDQHVLLHFGAVDFESEVYVNGKNVGVHKGGYDPFTYDITPYLHSKGPQELIVRVYDPTNAGGQPRGKQSLKPGGIMYTPTSGIWQTVWLEPAPANGIDNLKIVPDLDHNQLKLTVNLAGPFGGEATCSVQVKDGDTVIQNMSGSCFHEIDIPIPNPKLWSPDSPFLYGLEVTALHDHVTSYFGMRKIEIGDSGGFKRILLNHQFVFEIGPLDQGFWPDGIYTAPTDDAIRNDIAQMKAFGFNMVRKHIKVEPARWYYWTDKLGLLIWQDMPSANSYPDSKEKVPPVDKDEYRSELKLMIETHWNSPSIILWTLFNESQGQFDTRELVDVVRKLDPSRLINEASGGDYFGAGDIHDVHSYPAPFLDPPSRYPNQANVCGEYGGIGYLVPGHTWTPNGHSYTMAPDIDELIYEYADFTDRLKKLRDENGLSAAVYTQITDVETELNGLMTYDRIVKADAAKIRAANHFAFPAPIYQLVLATSEKVPQRWKFTTRKPGPDWNLKTFDDSLWSEGPGAFGQAVFTGTTDWTTPDIWLRKTFNPGNLTADQISHLVLRNYHDEDVEIFINGVPAYTHDGFVRSYEYDALIPAGRQAIVPNADNLIAVHCHQTVGGQYIDVGIYERVPGTNP